MTTQVLFSKIKELSDEFAALVSAAAPYVVRVEDGSSLTGTGVIWEADGIVVTSSHGLERDEDLSIETSEGAQYQVSLVGRDPASDLAVLRADAGELAAAPKEDGSNIKIGQLVFALGSPARHGIQATIGLINSRYEVQTNGLPEYILKTDAMLYPGFSGGPLVNAEGKVVGIANRWFGRGSSVALGVPIVDQVVASLKEHGRVPRGFLGVRTQIVELPTVVRSVLERDQTYGLLIVQVEPGSPSELAGILLGDTLVAIDAEPLNDVESLRNHLRPGKTLLLETVRGGQKREVQVTVAAQS